MANSRRLDENSQQLFEIIIRSTTTMARCQPEALASWVVSTDTHNRGGYMGDHSDALTWSSVVDEWPDWKFRAGRRIVLEVSCEG